jgi:hypothetical protein
MLTAWWNNFLTGNRRTILLAVNKVFSATAITVFEGTEYTLDLLGLGIYNVCERKFFKSYRSKQEIQRIFAAYVTSSIYNGYIREGHRVTNSFLKYM